MQIDLPVDLSGTFTMAQRYGLWFQFTLKTRNLVLVQPDPGNHRNERGKGKWHCGSSWSQPSGCAVQPLMQCCSNPNNSILLAQLLDGSTEPPSPRAAGSTLEQLTAVLQALRPQPCAADVWLQAGWAFGTPWHRRALCRPEGPQHSLLCTQHCTSQLSELNNTREAEDTFLDKANLMWNSPWNSWTNHISGSFPQLQEGSSGASFSMSWLKPGSTLVGGRWFANAGCVLDHIFILHR